MPKKGSPKPNSTKKKFSFDFEQTSPFNGPDEEVTLPLQSLRALKLISISQLSYAFVGYAVTITGGILTKSNDIVGSFIQAPGGISLLSIIAALLVLVECRSRNNRSQLIAYMVLIALDMVGWMVKLFFTLDAHFFKNPYSAESITSLAPFVFVLLLMLLGIIEAWVLKRSSTDFTYSPLSTQNSAPSDELSARTFKSLCFYALRRVCIIQLVYIIILGYVYVGTSYKNTDALALDLMFTPAVAIFTVIATIYMFIGTGNSFELPKRYMIAVGIDFLIAIARVVIGFAIGQRLYTADGDIKTYFLNAGLWNLFTFILWIIGFSEAYRTKRIVFEHNSISSHIDHIFSL